jgi:hypothetical protein
MNDIIAMEQLRAELREAYRQRDAWNRIANKEAMNAMDLRRCAQCHINDCRVMRGGEGKCPHGMKRKRGRS